MTCPLILSNVDSFEGLTALLYPADAALAANSSANARVATETMAPGSTVRDSLSEVASGVCD